MHGLEVIDRMLEQGVEEGAFPRCSAVVQWQGRPVYEGGNAGVDALFDLASLTKVMCTTALWCRVFRDGRATLEDSLARWFPESPAADVSLADLLYHRSGLPAFVPFFATALEHYPELCEPYAHAARRAQVRREVLAAAVATPLERPPGREAVYSDVGFILLGAVLEKLFETPLDVLFQQAIAEPLRLKSARFNRVSCLPLGRTVPTGDTRPRPPAPGQEGLWSLPERPTLRGTVDDDNAYVLDGVSGHAGLFGTARDVAAFGQAVLSGWLKSPVGWDRDGRIAGSTRALGFDTPSADAPSCGLRLAQGGHVLGHLGFTGTSLWLDGDRGLVVVLLTNRTALGRDNMRLRAFRPRFHDAVMDALRIP